MVEELEKNYKGGKLNNPKTINNCLDDLKEISEIAGLVGTYSYLSVAVDQTNTDNQIRQMKVSNIMSENRSKLSFVESELIQLEEEILEKAMEESEENRKFLEDIKREKKTCITP